MSVPIIELPMEHYSPEEYDQSRGAVLPDGYHHILILSATQPKDKEYILLGYKVLASAAGAVPGTYCTERLPLAQGDARKRLYTIATRLGWMARQGQGAWAQPFRFDANKLVGLDAVVRTTTRKYQDKNGADQIESQWGFADFWASGDERVAHVPKGDARPATGRAASVGMQAAQAAANGDFSDL